jgi:hypothetical protein
MLHSPLSASQIRERFWMVGLSIALAVYCLILGVAFLAGALSTTRSSWLLALVPLVLALWYGYGFLQPNNLPSNSASGGVSTGASAADFGLLLLAGGWALVVLALLVPSPTTNATTATSAGNVTASICSVLAVLCILCGAALSWRSWNERTRQQSDNI